MTKLKTSVGVEATAAKTKPNSDKIALRDFKCQYDRERVIIAKGDDLSDRDFPDWLWTNLTTENVLKG